MCTHGYWNQTKFPIHKVCIVAKRGLTNRANIHTPMSGRIPINPAIVAAIGHRFNHSK